MFYTSNIKVHNELIRYFFYVGHTNIIVINNWVIVDIISVDYSDNFGLHTLTFLDPKICNRYGARNLH